MPDIRLRDFSIGERKKYVQNYCVSVPLISDFTYSSLFMWKDFYSLKLSDFENLSCIICTGGEFKPSLMMPVGNISSGIKPVIDYYYNWFTGQGLEFEISHVEEQYIPLITSTPGYNFTISYNRDYSDYIYKRTDIINMKGAEFKSIRKKIRSFSRHYPDQKFGPLKKEDIPECLELIELWKKQKGYDADSSETALLLNHFEDLNLRGSTVKLKGKINAFLLGEVYGKNGYVIAGKADMKLHGLYLYALKNFVQKEFQDAEYINRCEDLGIETLREAKLSWMPVKILHKYNVACSKVI